MGTSGMVLVGLALWLGLSTRRRLRRLVVGAVIGTALFGVIGTGVALAMFGPGAIREYSERSRGGGFPMGDGMGSSAGGAERSRPTGRGWRPTRDPLRFDRGPAALRLELI